MNESRRKFLTFATGAIAGVGAVLASIPFVKSMNPPKHIKQKTWDIDFAKLRPGQLMVHVVESKPIFIALRTKEDLEGLDIDNNKLKDPDSEESDQPELSKNKYRSIEPEIFVAEGLCTHLGCSPAHVKSDQNFLPPKATGGYFCPCHGAVYDSAGRVLKGGPAPRNLRVPVYEFIEDRKIRISPS